jgi:hypothetical protein
MNQDIHTQESLENHTKAELKHICKFKGLKKTGKKNELIERILTYQEENTEGRRIGFGFFKGTDTPGSTSKWNPFKKAIPKPLQDTNTTIQESIQDQKQKIPLMKKISQTFSKGIKSLKHKASRRFSTISAAQQGSFITPAGSSKKPSFDVVLLSSELDELDIAERSLQDMIPLEQPTMPSGPSTQSTLFPEFTASQIRKGKFREALMDVEAIPEDALEDFAAGLFVQDVGEEDNQSDYESGYYDSEGEYWSSRMIEVCGYLIG